MSKCGKCNTDFNSSDQPLKCVECKLCYHPACTRLGPSQNIAKSKVRTWKCDLCKGESASVQSNDDVDDKKSILEALDHMKADINSNINSKINDLRCTLTELTGEFKQLNTKVQLVEEGQGVIKQRCSKLEQDRERLTGEVRELRQQLRDADQHSRSANLEIQGLPLSQNEDIDEILANVAHTIQIPFSKEDISIAHRLRLYSKKHNFPPLIVQFVSRKVRDIWLSAARRKRKISATEIAAHFQPTSVYINEHLTSHNKALLGRARRLVREKKLSFAGFFNGKVLIKAKEGDAASRVLDIEDMDKYDRMD